jgi:DNA-binding MarR family transcriptional regulator
MLENYILSKLSRTWYFDSVSTRAVGPAGEPGGGLSFLLVQLGFHAAATFADRLAPLGIEPRHYGVLSRLATNEGTTQRAIAELSGLNPTRMVFLIDELEQLGLAERRPSPVDRRSHNLYLTDQGKRMLGRAKAVARAHSEQLAAVLKPVQRRQLMSLLRTLADAAQITPDSLPGTTRTV